MAAAFALLGVAFYALLLPGHLVSQFNAQLFKADVGMFADSMCLSGDAGKSKTATSCPICKGLAAFQMAVVPPDMVALPAMPHASATIAALREDVARAAIPPPRSRGPPLHA